jgi:uncharacterized protein (TIGR03084 family)
MADLDAESSELDLLVAGLPVRDWTRTTPAPGWTVAHQIAHLAWTDDIATLAATDASGFRSALQAELPVIETFADRGAEEWVQRPPAELLAVWRRGRSVLADALGAVPRGTRLPWFGPPMSATSMATARLMETWAHGQDIADALGAVRPVSGRIRHVAHIGVRTRDFAYLLRDRRPPTEPFRVELTGPCGAQWTWGPADAAQRISGPALHFCLLVTRRRHRGDLALAAEGAAADEWLDIAQAFAGPPGAGREKGQFA